VDSNAGWYNSKNGAIVSSESGSLEGIINILVCVYGVGRGGGDRRAEGCVRMCIRERFSVFV
jgi:hypothetical protein